MNSGMERLWSDLQNLPDVLAQVEQARWHSYLRQVEDVDLEDLPRGWYSGIDEDDEA